MADNNFESYWGEKIIRITTREIEPLNPLQYSDILKFSTCEDVKVINCSVSGGTEDCIDAVRGKDYEIRDCEFYPHGNGGITVKGGIDGFHLKNVRFMQHGRKYDIEIGMFDDYWTPFGYKRTKHVYLENVDGFMPGVRVNVKVWCANDIFIVQSPAVEIEYKPWIVWYPYFLSRYAQLKLKSLKNKLF